jgi:hypothetical protein
MFAAFHAPKQDPFDPFQPIGNRQGSEISRYDVETFLADKAKKYCRNTLRGMRASLSRVLSWSVACDWIGKNPCAGVRLPLAGSKVKRTILTSQQVAAIASRLEEPYSTLVIFLAATGLRIGEAVGIKWSDFEGDTVHIRRRIYERREGTTKTKSSERSIPIPAALLERMKLLGLGTAGPCRQWKVSACQSGGHSARPRPVSALFCSQTCPTFCPPAAIPLGSVSVRQAIALTRFTLGSFPRDLPILTGE